MKSHLESRAVVAIAPLFYRALFLGRLSRRYTNHELINEKYSQS